VRDLEDLPSTTSLPGLGAVAGFAATVVMTAMMQSLHERLPAKERYPLAPRELTELVAGGQSNLASQAPIFSSRIIRPKKTARAHRRSSYVAAEDIAAAVNFMLAQPRRTAVSLMRAETGVSIPKAKHFG
jgi:hypothetical protein